jgi:hypothetical protein
MFKKKIYLVKEKVCKVSVFKYAKYGPAQLAFAAFTAGIALGNEIMEVVGGALLALMVGFVIIDVLSGRKRKEESKIL